MNSVAVIELWNHIYYLLFAVDKFMNSTYNNSVINNIVIGGHMAVRNSALDKKIINAANKEFLKEGFTKASLRKIAQKAGITTGALYTRYKNKDELFCSLVSDVCKKFDEQFTYLMPLFYTAIDNKSIDKYVQIVHLETQNILSLMYSNYDACVLLLNCSKGSSVENWFEQMIQRIITEAQQFYYSFLGDGFNKKALELIIVAQFSIYKQVIQNGYSKEEAESCLKVVSKFFDSGWKMIMDDVDF